jgi:MarR family transcriptional regulator, organic hydroperoxide resistance regulator
MGEVLGFMQGLWAVDHGLQSMSKWMRKRLGVTGPQRLVVRMVGKFPGIAAGELAGLMRVHPSTLTGVLRRLEQRGLIRRLADPDDARRALFRLTPRGGRLDTARIGTVEAAVRRALGRVPRRNLDTAARILRTVAEELTRGVGPEAKREARGA